MPAQIGRAVTIVAMDPVVHRPIAIGVLSASRQGRAKPLRARRPVPVVELPSVASMPVAAVVVRVVMVPVDTPAARAATVLAAATKVEVAIKVAVPVTVAVAVNRRSARSMALTTVRISR